MPNIVPRHRYPMDHGHPNRQEMQPDVFEFEQRFGHDDDCAMVDDFHADCTCRGDS